MYQTLLGTDRVRTYWELGGTSQHRGCPRDHLGRVYGPGMAQINLPLHQSHQEPQALQDHQQTGPTRVDGRRHAEGWGRPEATPGELNSLVYWIFLNSLVSVVPVGMLNMRTKIAFLATSGSLTESLDLDIKSFMAQSKSFCFAWPLGFF